MKYAGIQKLHDASLITGEQRHGISFRALFLVFFAPAQILFVSGCAAVPKQPVQIPAFVPGNEKFGATPKIAGSYANEGEAFTVKGKNLGPVLLSRMLLIDKTDASSWYGGVSNIVKALYDVNPTNASADSVTVLEPEPNVIDMQFFKRGQEVAMRRFSKYTWSRATGGHGIFEHWDSSKLGQPYYAVRGFVDILTREEYGLDAGWFASQGDIECLLRKASDGSLVVLYRQQLMRTVFPVVTWSAENIWSRFPPIEDSSRPQPRPAISPHEP